MARSNCVVSLREPGFGRFDAGFRLRRCPRIEQGRIGRLNAGQNGLAGDHGIADIQPNAQQPAAERRRHHVPFFNPRLSVFRDRDLQRSPLNGGQIDSDRFRQHGIDNRPPHRDGHSEQAELPQHDGRLRSFRSGHGFIQ